MSGMNETQNRQIETYNMSVLQVFVDPRQLKDRVKIWSGGKDRPDKCLQLLSCWTIKINSFKLHICFDKCKVGLNNYCSHEMIKAEQICHWSDMF